MSDRGGDLPGTREERDDAERIVLHVDMDCFYAACERLREPALRGNPSSGDFLHPSLRHTDMSPRVKCAFPP